LLRKLSLDLRAIEIAPVSGVIDDFASDYHGFNIPSTGDVQQGIDRRRLSSNQIEPSGSGSRRHTFHLGPSCAPMKTHSASTCHSRVQ
jgi:hypothetical protein